MELFSWLFKSGKPKKQGQVEIAETEEENVTASQITEGDYEKIPAPSSRELLRRGRPSRQNPPDKPGIYRIVNKETEQISYIGVTKNLRRRKAEHKRTGKFSAANDYFFWQRARDGASLELLYQHERRKIAQHRPSNNQRNGGGGRRSGAAL